MNKVMFKSTKPIYTIAGIASIVTIGALISSAVYADDVVDQIQITVPVSCSVEGTGMTSHTAEINNGTYVANIGTTTMHAFCNDSNGFAVYATGYTGNEIGATNSNKLVGTAASNNATIDTGTATAAGNPDVSNWAMKLSMTQDSGDTSGSNAFAIDNSFDAYHAVPNSYTKVAHKNSGTDMTAVTGGAKLTTTYAAYISKTQPADTYTGQVIYTLVHPASEEPIQPQSTASGKICYYANASSAEGTMGCQTISASDTTAELFASNFNRTGYGFAGWSDAYDYATNNSANFYGPNETISFTAGQYTGSNPGLSRYAVWVKSAGNFQDSSKTTTVCNGLTAASTSGTRTLASVSALTDIRDNQTYAIARLADGNCWMIENLRLDNTAQLTTLNTNNPLNDNDPTNPTVTLKHNYADTQTYNTLSVTSNVAYNADTAPDGWCNTNSSACDDQSRLRTDNTANRVTYTSGQTMSTDANLYSYGNYYNWYSATAGRGTYGFSTNNNSTAGDLCPTNWRLPKGGSKSRIESNDDNEFWNLIVDVLNGGTNPANYASKSSPYYTGSDEAGPVDALIRTWPNDFVHSGAVGGASLGNRGSLGNYWSSTSFTTNDAYRLYFLSTNVSPGTDRSSKYFGKSIRCMVSPGA